ncbi:Pyridoxine 5'-phosphate synthase [Hartmannibacter diazotrophicus]|uniref:Pyridoxine 5'-phosphate synthase n=1 Tax=Hartmannibacter diazotrophicus TaxID=1482074 RepID=A0A2C9DCJ0_9HYPH|nr:pyridoxine 5'-phosphate synthase [Hartmannibacter diazotrophicus]SON57890.1 Pyridoxine 5'-phosphate synthase [Hartmannibacter diazotrophicus]
MTTTKLSVNVNAIAQLRNRRDLPWPSVTGLSAIALEAGAYGITIHPRPDQRHIRRTDVFDLQKLLRGEWKDKEFNIEGYPTHEFLELCALAQPDQVTLVPDDPSQSTSDHGWDTQENASYLSRIIDQIHTFGARVSVFVDADAGMAEGAAKTGADRVEFYTGPYGHAVDPDVQDAELKKLAEAAEAARTAGLAVNAGHDLTLANMPKLKAAIPYLAEVSIGHALTADALIYGMAETIRLYREACGDPVR